MPDYINPPGPPTDPVDISDSALDYIRGYFPNFNPQEAQLAVVIIAALALRAAGLNDLAGMVPRAIYRTFGADLIGLPPGDGSRATATVSISVRDSNGYTIEDGTLLGIEDVNGDLHLFQLVSPAVIPLGQTTISNVVVEAEQEGATANNITAGNVTMVDALDYVTNVTQQGTSSGGSDPEEDDDYLNRLSRRLGLIPRPVVAEDFANLMLVEWPEIYRAFARNRYTPGLNEIQEISHAATAGTITLVFEGQTTTALSFNETAASLKTRLEALSNIAVDEVIVTGGPWPTAPLRIEFTGTLGNSNRTQITAGTNSLTGGGGAASFSVVTARQGQVFNADTDDEITVGGIYEDGLGLSTTLKAEVAVFLAAQRLYGFVVNVADPTFHDIAIVYSIYKFPQYSDADVAAGIDAALRGFLSPLTWGSTPDDARAMVRDPEVALNSIIGVINGVQGVQRVNSVTIGLNGGAPAAANATMTGTWPLPRPATITGTIALMP